MAAGQGGPAGSAPAHRWLRRVLAAPPTLNAATLVAGACAILRDTSHFSGNWLNSCGACSTGVSSPGADTRSTTMPRTQLTPCTAGQAGLAQGYAEQKMHTVHSTPRPTWAWGAARGKRQEGRRRPATRRRAGHLATRLLGALGSLTSASRWARNCVAVRPPNSWSSSGAPITTQSRTGTRMSTCTKNVAAQEEWMSSAH